MGATKTYRWDRGGGLMKPCSIWHLVTPFVYLSRFGLPLILCIKIIPVLEVLCSLFPLADTWLASLSTKCQLTCPGFSDRSPQRPDSSFSETLFNFLKSPSTLWKFLLCSSQHCVTVFTCYLPMLESHTGRPSTSFFFLSAI